MTLNQPSVQDIFKNNEVTLKCIIAGRDESFVNGVEITWEIDGKTVTNITKSREQDIITTMKTWSRTEWQSVNHVRCSASSDDVTPVIQDLTVHKGGMLLSEGDWQVEYAVVLGSHPTHYYLKNKQTCNNSCIAKLWTFLLSRVSLSDGQKPKVTVHVLQEEVIQKDNTGDVTLVCLVSSSMQQDYYIAWTEYIGEKTDVYENGINFPQQKTQNGYLVTSVYTTKKANWNRKYVYECNVWHAGSFTVQNVSKAQGNSLECDR